MHTLTEQEKTDWYRIVFGLKKQFGKKPDMNIILYLIGINELGTFRTFTKDEKQDLMHIATCYLLSYDGYYQFIEYDKEGWPHFELINKLPYADLMQQEAYLQHLIVRYYNEKGLMEDL